MAYPSITARDRRRWSRANAYRRGLGNKFQTVSVTDLIAEGEIEGLADTEASVYLDGDPIANSAKEVSFSSDDFTITVNATGTNAAVTVYEDGSSTSTAFSSLAATENRERRFIFIYDVVTINAKILQVHQGDYEAKKEGYLVVEKISGTDNFLYDYVTDNANIVNGNHRCRVYKDTTYEEYFLAQIMDTEGGSAKTSGNANFGKLNAVPIYGTGIATLFDPDEDVNRNVTIKVDVCFRVDISSSKVLTLYNNTKYTIGTNSATSKNFSLSQTVNSYNETIKVDESTVQFRKGTRTQAPLKQLAGVGVSSLSLIHI